MLLDKLTERWLLSTRLECLSSSLLRSPGARSPPSVPTIGKKCCFFAYSAKGWTKFKEVTSNISIENSGNNYGSVDGDETLHKDQEGDNPLIPYNAKTEARLVATVAIQESKKIRNFNEVFAHAIADNEIYESNIQTAVKTLSVRKGAGIGDEIRKLEFAVPVKQVISCRHHTGG